MSETRIVVDLGCMPHQGDVSVETLIDRYHPRTLYGFDPLLPGEGHYYLYDGCKISLQRKAAWLFDGELELALGADSLLDATVVRDKNDVGEWRRSLTVPCFNFVEWLDSIGEPVLLKMNVEGAEFELLQALLDAGQAPLIEQLIVSWHDQRMGASYTAWREKLTERFTFPSQTWQLAT